MCRIFLVLLLVIKVKVKTFWVKYAELMYLLLAKYGSIKYIIRIHLIVHTHFGHFSIRITFMSLWFWYQSNIFSSSSYFWLCNIIHSAIITTDQLNYVFRFDTLYISIAYVGPTLTLSIDLWQKRKKIFFFYFRFVGKWKQRGEKCLACKLIKTSISEPVFDRIGEGLFWPWSKAAFPLRMDLPSLIDAGDGTVAAAITAMR